MINFLIKKTFYDFWDNLYSLFLFGLGVMITGTFFIACFVTFRDNAYMIYATCVVGLIVLGQFFAALFLYTNDIAESEPVKVKEIVVYAAYTWKINLIISSIFIAILTLAVTGVPFYLSTHRLFGIISAGVIIGTFIIVGLVLLFFYPFYIRNNGRIIESVKQSARFVADNPFFAIGVVIGIIAIMTFSSLSYMIFPGIGAVILWINVSVRLRLYKYDYLRENPGASPGKIPWEKLLKKDIALYEKRGIFSRSSQETKKGS